MSDTEILLVYDKECPLCDAYCRMVRIREAAGSMRIVDARESSTVMDEITAMGLDIDQGMVLKVGERLYYGSDAINALALIGSPVNFFNQMTIWIFRSERRAHFLYPILKFFRNLLLKLLGRSKINNLDLAGNDRF